MKEAITLIKDEIKRLRIRQQKIAKNFDDRDEHDDINFKVERLERAIRAIHAIEMFQEALH